MFDKNLIRTIQEEFAQWDRPVLSVYLNVDPSHETNLNQGYLARYKTALREAEKRLALDEAALERFRIASKAVEEQLSDYEPDAKALILFRTPRGHAWRRGIRMPVRECVEWAEQPILEPLAELLDEQERYGVALVDRAHARVFVVHLGEIEEVADLVAHDVSRIKTTGTDHRWSEKNFQRRADEHVRRHAQETAEVLAETDRKYGFDRLLVAGVADGRERLESELPESLKRKLTLSVPMSIVATPQEIVKKVEEVHEHVERAEEVDLVDLLMADAAGNGRAVAGLQPTVRALGEGRVRELIVAGNFHPHWDQLSEPAAWLHEKPGDASDDLLERMVERTSESGGRVELVWGQAAERLAKEGGGIGAILRY